MTVVATFVGLMWRRLFRDPAALAFTFGLPVAVAVVMVSIYTTDYASVGLVVGDGSRPVGDAIVEELDHAGLVKVTRYRDVEGLERAIRRREVAVGVVVPADALVGTDVADVTLLGAPGTEAPSGVRSVVESAVTRTAAAIRIGRAIEPGASPAAALEAGERTLTDVPLQPYDEETATDRRNEAGAMALAGALVLFVFTNTLGGASTLAELRTLGVLSRARTTSASLPSITLGFALGFASYALVQAGLMFATGWLIFGVTWTSWAATLAVVVLTAIAAAALSVLVATVLPSPDMGTTVAGPLGFVLGMLGGCLYPLALLSPTLQRLGHLTPQAWAVEALQSTGVRGHGLADVGTPLGVLALMAVGLSALGGWRLIGYTRHA